MAVSNSSDFTVTRNTLLDKTGQLLGIVAEGGTCSANQYTDLASWLNLMIKDWQKNGPQLWLMEEIILFPIKSRANYYIGGSSTDRACLTEELVQTELSAAASDGATTITVDSITGIAASDKIGIETDEDGIHWTTVSGSPSGSTITLTAALVGDAASGSQVYTYTNAFTHKPVKIRHVFYRDDNNVDLPIDIVSHQEYNSLTNKAQTGNPLLVYADPQRDEMQMYVWPVAGNSDLNKLFYMSVQRTVYDFDTSTDNPDFPQEWFLALAYNCAFYAAPVYGLSDSRFNRIAGIATTLKKELLDWSTEDTSIFIVPNKDHR